MTSRGLAACAADPLEQIGRIPNHFGFKPLCEATGHVFQEQPRLPGSLLSGQELGEGCGRAQLEQERLLPAGHLDPLPEARLGRDAIALDARWSSPRERCSSASDTRSSVASRTANPSSSMVTPSLTYPSLPNASASWLRKWIFITEE